MSSRFLGPRQLLGARVAPELAEDFKEIAKANGQTTNDVLAALIHEYVHGMKEDADRRPHQEAILSREAVLRRSA